MSLISYPVGACTLHRPPERGLPTSRLPKLHRAESGKIEPWRRVGAGG